MTSDVEQKSSRSHNPRQVIATVVCVIVLSILAWFWSEQVQEVIEMLELAYGDGS